MDSRKQGRGKGRSDGGRGGGGRGRGPRHGEGSSSAAHQQQHGSGSGRGRGGRGRDGRGSGRGGRDGRGGGGGGGRGGGPATISPQQAIHKMVVGEISAPAPGGASEGVPRPGVGTAGRKIQVETNHFALTTGMKKAFMYDVIVIRMIRPRNAPPGAALIPETPEEGAKLPTNLCQIALSECMKQHGVQGGWVYDGWKSLFSKSRLPDAVLGVQKQIDFKEPGYDLRRTYQIEINATKHMEVDMSDMADRDALRVVDSIMKQPSASNPDLAMYGRSFYSQKHSIRVDPTLEIRKGYSQTTRNCQGGLQFILDTKAAAFFPSTDVLNVFEAIAQWDPRRGKAQLSRQNVTDIGMFLKGLTIQVTSPYKKKYKCKGILKSATEQTFKIDGVQWSVADHFAQTNRKLNYPELPCLDVSTSKKKVCYLPPEMCSIVSEKKKSQNLTQEEASEVIKVAALPPERRMMEIGKNVKSLDQGFLNQFNTKVSSTGIQVDARVLPSPALEYGKKKCIDVGNKGSWNFMNGEFLQGGNIKSWAVACINIHKQGMESGLHKFLEHLTSKMKSLGIKVAGPPPVEFGPDRDRYGDGAEDVIDKAVHAAEKTFNERPNIIFCILKDSRIKGLKGRVKAKCDCELGIVSQVILSESAWLRNFDRYRGADQFCFNVSMKVNAKIGGKNWSIPKGIIEKFIKHERVMLIGADVTHSPAGGRSIAAVVASMDREICQYASHTVEMEMDSQQEKKAREIITAMPEAICALLGMYRQRNSCLPDVILFYRDGIADNQFQECQKTEVIGIDQACRKISPTYKPKVGFIVVQKRHLTRFKPVDGNKDKSGNVLAGTVVDTKICHPKYFDFYLNSHAGILGSSKAAHYHVLRDDIGFGPDGAQLFTNYLCYLYQRCTRSVSYCPPAYFAHLAAARARELEGQGAMIHPDLASTFHFI